NPRRAPSPRGRRAPRAPPPALRTASPATRRSLRPPRRSRTRSRQSLQGPNGGQRGRASDWGPKRGCTAGNPRRNSSEKPLEPRYFSRPPAGAQKRGRSGVRILRSTGRIVAGLRGNAIRLRGPCAEVHRAATLRAEWPRRIPRLEDAFLPADGTRHG